MILVDANLLLYAKIDYFPEHQQSNCWLDNILRAQPRLGIPWESINAFIRLSTNPRIFEQPGSRSGSGSPAPESGSPPLMNGIRKS